MRAAAWHPHAHASPRPSLHPGPGAHTQKVDVANEDPDQTVERLANFLKIIKYKPNYDP